jgi:hypothetical protein
MARGRRSIPGVIMYKYVMIALALLLRRAWER